MIQNRVSSLKVNRYESEQNNQAAPKRTGVLSVLADLSPNESVIRALGWLSELSKFAKPYHHIKRGKSGESISQYLTLTDTRN